MALRRALGWSEGEVMRPESKPCSRLMRQTAGIFSVGGGLAFWVLCRLHYGHYSCPSNHLLSFFVQLYASCQLYLLSFLTVQVLCINPELEPFCWPCVYSVGPRITVPRSLRWASCGAVSVSASTALLVRLFSPECEPQNIAAYDKPELKPE